VAPQVAGCAFYGEDREEHKMSWWYIDELDKKDAEIERLRAVIQAYLDYCAPQDLWRGEPTLLRIRRQMRELLQNQVGPAAGEPVTGQIDPDAPHISAQENDK
jgi:hypothetical protein